MGRRVPLPSVALPLREVSPNRGLQGLQGLQPSRCFDKLSHLQAPLSKIFKDLQTHVTHVK